MENTADLAQSVVPDMVTREIWWNIHGGFSKPIFYLMALASIGIFIYGFYKKFERIRSGKKLADSDKRFSDIKERIFKFISHSLLHLKLKRKKIPGLAHFLTLYGFIILLIVTIIVGIQDHLFKATYFFQGGFYKLVSFAADFAGVMVFIGVVIFLLRRYVFKSKSLDERQQDWIQPVFLLLFIVMGFLIEGFRMAATDNIESFAPIGARIANFVNFMRLEDMVANHKILWWLHSAQTFLFIAIIPYTKFAHMITSPINTFLYSKRARGELSTPYKLMEIMEAEAEGKEFDEEVLNIGVNQISDFNWKTLMDSEACTACGRCHIVCPAANTDKALSPKHLMLDIKALASMPSEAETSPYASISEDVLWSCTSCGACVEECPILIEHVDTIVDMRRGLLQENKVPSNLQATLKNLRTKFNPWGQAPSDRSKWVGELNSKLSGDSQKVQTVKENSGFEYLYWVGSPGAYDPKNIEVTKANSKMFLKAGVNFAILGDEEKTTGDIARRAGDEGLFQELAIENIEILMRYGVKKIIVQCPHAYNTFKNEYPELGLQAPDGSEIEVIHHTELLAKLMQEGKLIPSKGVNSSITYHDPCYLARYNEIMDPPRFILERIPGLEIKTIKNEKKSSTCCGGGGAQIWYEMPGTQINSLRLEELNAHNPNKVATACPYCNIMISSATKSVFPGTNIPEIEDVAVILSESCL